MTNHSTPKHESENGLFRVMVCSKPDDPKELRDILVRVLGLHPTDAQVHAHAAPGLLRDVVSRSVADELASAINGLGIHAVVVPQADVPQLLHTELVHHLRLLDEGLELIDLHGQPEGVVPWNDIELLSAGAVPLESTRHYAIDSTAVVSAAPRLPHATFLSQEHAGLEAWFICQNPSRCFRIDHNRMNYESLGDQKTGSADVNFHRLLNSILHRLTNTYVTPATRAIAQNGHPQDYTSKSTDDLKQQTIFHTLMHRQMTAPFSQD